MTQVVVLYSCLGVPCPDRNLEPERARDEYVRIGAKQSQQKFKIQEWIVRVEHNIMRRR